MVVSPGLVPPAEEREDVPERASEPKSESGAVSAARLDPLFINLLASSRLSGDAEAVARE